MKKSERKEIYSKIAIAINKGETKDAYEHLRNVASDEGLFILTEYKQNKLADAAPQLLEALELTRNFVYAYYEEDVVAPGLLSKIDEAIKAAKGE